MRNEQLRSKNLILAIEFSRYVLAHPSFSKRVPRGARIVLVPKHDSPLRRANLRLADRIRKEHPDQPLAIVQFDGLALAQSRLKNPRLLTA